MIQVLSRQYLEPKLGLVCGAAVAIVNIVRPKVLGFIGLLPYGVLGALWAVNAANRELNRVQRQLVATTVGNLSYRTCVVLLPEPRDSWIRFMDPESVEWLSEMLKQIWPYINQATHSAVAKLVVNALMENKHLDVEVKQLDFGDQPPVVTVSSSRDTPNNDEVLLDVGIKWASHPTIEVVAKVKGVPFWVSLKDFQLFGVLTLKLVLADKMPLVSLIEASFHKPPKVDFNLNAMGASLVNSGPDSGISGQIMKIVDNVVANICVWPNRANGTTTRILEVTGQAA